MGTFNRQVSYRINQGKLVGIHLHIQQEEIHLFVLLTEIPIPTFSFIYEHNTT